MVYELSNCIYRECGDKPLSEEVSVFDLLFRNFNIGDSSEYLYDSEINQLYLNHLADEINVVYDASEVLDEYYDHSTDIYIDNAGDNMGRIQEIVITSSFIDKILKKYGTDSDECKILLYNLTNISDLLLPSDYTDVDIRTKSDTYFHTEFIGDCEYQVCIIGARYMDSWYSPGKTFDELIQGVWDANYYMLEEVRKIEK